MFTYVCHIRRTHRHNSPVGLHNVGHSDTNCLQSSLHCSFLLYRRYYLFFHNYLKDQNSGCFFKNKVLSLLSYYQKVDKPLNINRFYKIKNYILHIKISEVRHLFQRTGHKISGEDFVNNWLLNKIHFNHYFITISFGFQCNFKFTLS